MSDTLTLRPSGSNGCIPDQLTWRPASGSSVEIHNATQHTQVLSGIDRGLLNPMDMGSDSITIPGGGAWNGRVGRNMGHYWFDDGNASAANASCDGDRGAREGTIDPA